MGSCLEFQEASLGILMKVIAVSVRLDRKPENKKPRHDLDQGFLVSSKLW